MGIHFANLRLRQMHFHKIDSHMHVSNTTLLVTVSQLLVSFLECTLNQSTFISPFLFATI